MSRAPSAADVRRLFGGGRYVPRYRSSPVGLETVTAQPAAEGGVRLAIDTAFEIHRLSVRQRVTAEFDAGLRPRWCIVSANVNSRQAGVEMELNGERATARHRVEGRVLTGSADLKAPPLLLVDNCFALHALAALRALAAAGTPSGGPPGAPAAPEAIFTALPAFQEIGALAPGPLAVRMGGRDYGVPDVTLRLGPDLHEHAWARAGRVERLILPAAQMAVDWQPDRPDTTATEEGDPA